MAFRSVVIRISFIFNSFYKILSYFVSDLLITFGFVYYGSIFSMFLQNISIFFKTNACLIPYLSN